MAGTVTSAVPMAMTIATAIAVTTKKVTLKPYSASSGQTLKTSAFPLDTIIHSERLASATGSILKREGGGGHSNM